MTERSEKIDRKEKIETVSWSSGIDTGVMRYDVPAVCASKISGILWNDHCRRNVCRSFCGSGSFSESGFKRSISGKDAKDREGFWYAFAVGRNFFGSGNCRSLYFLLFPEKVFEASQGISAGMESVPFMMAAFIIAVTPAICEEAVFRGVFLNSLMGRWNKWIPILITGIVFGMFHGSVVRFFPTAILGIVMGYIVVETGNIFYSMLFHFVNNLFPVLLTQLLEISSQGIETEAEIMMMEIPLASVGMYMCIGVAAPFLIYIGNYLLHKGEEGHSDKLFPRQKRISLILLSGISAVLFIFGGILCVIGMSYMMQYVQLY